MALSHHPTTFVCILPELFYIVHQAEKKALNRTFFSPFKLIRSSLLLLHKLPNTGSIATFYDYTFVGQPHCLLFLSLDLSNFFSSALYSRMKLAFLFLWLDFSCAYFVSGMPYNRLVMTGKDRKVQFHILSWTTTYILSKRYWTLTFWLVLIDII